VRVRENIQEIRKKASDWATGVSQRKGGAQKGLRKSKGELDGGRGRETERF